MAWEFELATLHGVTVGLLQPRSVAVTRNLNGASTVTLESETAPALTTAALVRGWRTPAAGGPRVLRATGKVSGVQGTASRDALEALTLTATDGFGVLSTRLLAEPATFVGITPREIIADIVDAQNLRAPTGLMIDTGAAAGPPRDRNYERGKNAADLIRQLSAVDDGFYFRVDPTDAAGWSFSELVLLYPDAGTDSEASLEWGEGTVGNLAGVTADVLPPVNYALAFGAGDGDAQLYSVKSDAASIDAYGLYDGSSSFNDVVEQATLDQHALDLLRPAERRTFRVTVGPSIGNGGLYVPSPWDDFDVGDTVALNLRGTSEALRFTGRAMVTAYTVTIDANGTERLSSIDLQAPDA